MDENEKILEELQAIKSNLIMSNSDKLDLVMNKIVNTPNRHKMWALIDGLKMPKEIADGVGVSSMAVSTFLKILTDSGLVIYDQGKPPRKAVDYTPVSWLDVEKENKGE